MLPLAGVRVVAVEQYGAGPFGSMLLGDLGADVIKIENPAEGGDVARAIGPYFFGPGDSQFFHAYNRNKRSLTLNLKRPEARRVLNDLVRAADATLDNLRGDQPAKLGVTYEALKQVNPKIVCAHLSGYGRDGPRASWPGYDYLMQAEAGYLALTGEPDGPPSRFGLSVVDQMAGVYAAFALVSGVLSARASGIGRDIDISLFDCALQNLAYVAIWSLNAGHNQGRAPRSGHPSLTPSQLYKTKDGYIFLMCNKEKFWPLLCEAIGRPDWSTRADYMDFKARLTNRDRLTAELDAVLSTRTTVEWIARFAGRVPAAPVNDVATALDNAFVTEQGRVRNTAHAGGDIRLLAPPLRCPGEELPCQAGPALGADTDDILSDLGYSANDIAQLRAAKAI